MKSTQKSARRRSRELALQGLYQWQITGNTLADIIEQLKEQKDYERSDQAYIRILLNGVITHAQQLEVQLKPHLDRPIKEVSPIERCVLLLASYELIHRPDVPYKAVINEAIELAKTFGGNDGHKFVNGVLDKLVLELGVRPSIAK